MTADERVEPTTVTVGWILEALDGKVPQWDKLRKESKIKCFETHLISGAGFLSNVLRLRVVFENGEHFPLILKATTTDKLTALYLADETAPTVDPSEDTTTMLIVSYHNQEINFYENIGNQYKGFQLAKMYGSKRSTLHPVEHGQILLEDVSHLGMLADNRVGLNLQQCESVIKTIANFHAYTLSLPNINEILKKMPNMMDAFEESAFDFVNRAAKIDPFFASHRQTLKQYMDDNVMQVENPHLRFELSGLLSHGDLWGNNIFFERNADGTCGNKVATILDFQCCYPGSGLDDLARFICTSASLEVLKEHEEHLLRLYFERINDELKSKGLPDRFPAYEKMLEVYKFHRMHEFLFSIFILLPISEQQTSAVERETTLGRLRHTFKQILIDMEQNK